MKLKNEPLFDVTDDAGMDALTVKVAKAGFLSFIVGVHAEVKGGEIVSLCSNCDEQLLDVESQWLPDVPLRYLKGVDRVWPPRRKRIQDWLSDCADRAVMSTAVESYGRLVEHTWAPLWAMVMPWGEISKVPDGEHIVVQAFAGTPTPLGLVILDQYEAEHGRVTV